MSDKQTNTWLTRRKFVRMALLASPALALIACGEQPTATPQPQTQQLLNTPTSTPQPQPQTQPTAVSTVQKSDSKKAQTPTAGIVSVNPAFAMPELLGRPTNNSIAVNIVPVKKLELYVEYGTESAKYTVQTKTIIGEAATPVETLLENLQPNTRYYYRVRYREPGASSFSEVLENSFVTQRAPGSAFIFSIQGDSHPERPQQFDADLYMQTMKNVQAEGADFFLTIGDDFSVDKLSPPTKEGVEQLYIYQRQFLAQIGKSSPVFLVNGNHEQAAKYLLDGTPNNVAVWAQNARNKYFSQPAPDNFYSGDTQAVEFIGQLRDYYAWTWGDALVVTIDPYWHSAVPVDSVLGGGGDKNIDLWDITLGDAQYQWLKKTLEESKAKYKFVFTHHVLGTGRGGTDMASQYEWGGKNKKGVWEFDKKRPGWELPIHQLMAKNGVTIFFQGHDHVFVKQELDGVIYQSLPEPADPNYAFYNADAYKSDVKYPNTGHVRVSVSAQQVKVEYISSVLPKNETKEKANGTVIYSYIVLPKN
ncbi:MAG: metallophosphoesterase [Chloroflexi bacterium]|uniref:Metallophosphoesterase n=1 Tax=Candidatus Chlorohelix allophototropha TaxID=3003348 RepID=A0A8T7M4G2_9CHLR|nr:metallophosphoesterase [Chloroflexota bacterium]WJW70041.1 metallophosphoesterase [Chloroflexota bacterium L227-S17]